MFTYLRVFLAPDVNKSADLDATRSSPIQNRISSFVSQTHFFRVRSPEARQTGTRAHSAVRLPAIGQRLPCDRRVARKKIQGTLCIYNRSTGDGLTNRIKHAVRTPHDFGRTRRIYEASRVYRDTRTNSRKSGEKERGVANTGLHNAPS